MENQPTNVTGFSITNFLKNKKILIGIAILIAIFIYFYCIKPRYFAEKKLPSSKGGSADDIPMYSREDLDMSE